MQIDIERFRDAFYTEATEHLQNMENALLLLETANRDQEVLNTIFRAAHSIKGASMTVGLNEVGRFTHVLEELLDRLRNGSMEATSELIELLLSSVDVIDGLISHAKDGAPAPVDLEKVYAELHQVGGRSASDHEAHEDGVNSGVVERQSQGIAKYHISIRPSRDFFRFGQDPLLLLRELNEIGKTSAINVDCEKLPTLKDLQPEDCYLSWTLELETSQPEQMVHDVFMFLDTASSYEVRRLAEVSQLKVASSPEKVESTVDQAVERRSGDDRRKSSDTETVRVDRYRLDDLINQIGELVIGTSMVEQELSTIAGGRTLSSITALAKIVRDLQELSLGLRMVPLAATFQKMNRVIRDVAKKIGKQIQFVTEGGDTELDKSVVDQISDPLVHMVRNAADHGIEPVEDRLAAGKPAEGTVRLKAFQQGGNVYIEVTDDGRGLNRKKLLSKAMERGLVARDANLLDAEICELIFVPGFSTADAVTDVSGRGVGMDVVRRNVETLQGSVNIRSEEGKGSTVTMRLPLTLAILDGLLVRLTNDVFVIPLLSVVESICLKPHEIREIVNVGEVITLRGEILPVLRLHRLLNIPGESEDSEVQILLVIIEDQGCRMAVKVDELLGQQQVVIKNLEINYRKVPGVAGATILGDGRVALIVDTGAMSGLVTSETQLRQRKTSSGDLVHAG